MPAVLKTLPTMCKQMTLPKTVVTGKAYSTIPKNNSFKQDKFNLSSSSPQVQSPVYIPKRSIQIKTPKTNDRQLHESFNGAMPRLLSLQNLFQEKGRKMFSELFLNEVIVTEQLFTGIKLYTDLQNPLLQKYRFDVQDFFHGTEEAFIQTQKAITLLHLINNDLVADRRENYQLKEIHRNILRAALSPKLYSAVQQKLSERIDPVSDAFRDYILTIDSLQLNSIIIEHVTTKLIEGDECNNQPGNIVDDYSMISYPSGSVLATVDVVFESEQLYEHCELKEKPKVKRTIHSSWKFQGCISGHTPLNWMVVAMKNHIKSSTLVRNYAEEE